MKKFIVVAYDVEDDRRRRQVAKLLEAIGKRVNKSVFECFLTERQFEKLRNGIDKRVTRYDSVLYYPLCRLNEKRHWFSVEPFGYSGKCALKNRQNCKSTTWMEFRRNV